MIDRYSLDLRTAAVRLRARSRILACDGACVSVRIRGASLRPLVCLRFKLVNEVGICGRIEILNLRGEVVDLLDLFLAQSECGESCVKGLNLFLHIRRRRGLGSRCLHCGGWRE